MSVTDVNRVWLPEHIQAKLPAGVDIISFDGELVYLETNSNHVYKPRYFQLKPSTHNELVYARRYTGSSRQMSFLAVEHFHSHFVTAFYAFVGDKQTKKTGLKRLESIGLYSWSTHQTLWVNNPEIAETIFEGDVNSRLGKELFKQFTGFDRRKVNDRYVDLLMEIESFVERDIKKLRESDGGQGERL